MPILDHPFYSLTAECRQYGATLVAVSKTRTIEETDRLYAMGQRIFAENRAQELLKKAPVMHSDIEWHLIGHLQTNKIRDILPWVSCIQSLDRPALWAKLQAEAARNNSVIKCLLQIKIAKEETKYGWAYEDLENYLSNEYHHQYPNIHLAGVMGMASLTDDMQQVHQEMRTLKHMFESLKVKFFQGDESFNILSMGMSGDYKIALEEGSTMVRIGSLLFR